MEKINIFISILFHMNCVPIDKSKAKSGHRQYYKNMSHPYGINIYMLSKPSSLVLKFILYSEAH